MRYANKIGYQSLRHILTFLMYQFPHDVIAMAQLSSFSQHILK